MSKKNLGLLLMLVFVVVLGVACAKEGNVGNVKSKDSVVSSGAELTFRDEKNSPVADVALEILQNGKVIEAVQTDSVGKAVVNLPAGEYVYAIKSTPDGFIIDGAEYKLTIAEGITSIEQILESVKSGISLNVKDESGNMVPSVKFVISKEGEEIVTLETDSDGKAVANLPAGEYVYAIKSTPDGFVIDETERKLTVAEGMTSIEQILEPVESGISLKAIDESGNMVPSVKFVISKEGEEIVTLETDSDGKAVVDLPTGDYSYTMQSVPNGYILDELESKLTIGSGITNIQLVLNSVV